VKLLCLSIKDEVSILPIVTIERGVVQKVTEVGGAACRYLYLYIAHVMAYSFVSDLRVAVYDHLQHLSARFFADRQTGELLKRVVSDTRDIEPLIAHYIPDMTVNFLLLIGVGIILFSLNPTLALLTMLPMPLLLFSNLFFGKRMRNALKDSSHRLGILSGIVQDNLVGIKEIQLFTQEPQEHQRIHEYSTNTTRIHLYGLKMQAILSPSIEFLTAMGLVIIVLFGGQAVNLHGILRFTDEGGTLFKDAREKNGIIHMLVYDEETGAKFKSGVEGLSTAADRIGKGEGMLGKLTSAESEATWNDVKSLAADASALAADLRSGKGAIGKLMSDPEVEAALVTIATRFASVATDASKLTDDARRGRGVIGWLFSDDEARRTVERLAKQLERAVEDAREAAPVTSVASFLFGQL
jgi:uncharacterized protein YjgD (DUF1641 family)